jgi:septal ring-binding cell division protein DamX
MLALETAEAVVSAPVISEPLVVEPVVVEPVVSAPVIIEPVVVEPVVADVAVEQVATDSVAVSPELQQPLEPAAAQPDEVLAQAAEQSPTLEPAAAAAPVAAPGFDSVPSIIQQRRLAFDDWTKSGQTDSYTLQVLFLGSEDIPYLESVLNNMDRSGLLAQTFACLTMTQNGYIWRILYGLFPNLEAARSNVRALPADLQSNQPFAQNLDRIECISPGEEQ